MQGMTDSHSPTDKHWKILESRRALDSRYYPVRCDKVQLPDGHVIDEWFVREASDSCIVFALTEDKPEDKHVVMVRLYRHGAQNVMLELPGGGCAPGEDHAALALRELQEETGYTADNAELVVSYYQEPAHSTARSYFFFVDNARPGPRQIVEEAEAGMEVELHKIDDVIRMLKNNEINGGIMAIGLYAILTAKGYL